MKITELKHEIKRLREQKRMSRQALGEAIGTTGMSIWRIETGRSEPQFEQVERIFTALNAQLKCFVVEENETIGGEE